MLVGSCPAEARKLPLIVAQAGGPDALPYGPARRPKVPGVLPGGVSRRPFVPDVFTGILVISQGFSELLGAPPVPGHFNSSRRRPLRTARARRRSWRVVC